MTLHIKRIYLNTPSQPMRLYTNNDYYRISELVCHIRKCFKVFFLILASIYSSIIYIRLFGKAIHLYIQYCLAEVPGYVQTNFVRSLFQNGRQRAEIAIL